MRSIRKQVEQIKKRRMTGNSVVSLNDFRDMKQAEKKKTVLVVDDEEIMRNALKRVLENHGYQVILAEDGVTLSKVLEISQLDLILLDVNLPWVDGYELCQLIKTHPVLKATPVVFISARKGVEDVQRGISSGAEDYITKPFDIDYLLNIVEKHLKNAG